MSFGWLGVVREGAWKAFRKFILEERRDVAKRILVIEAELQRIGTVTVQYERIEQGDGTFRVTERRKGLTVTQGTSLGKLMQAYVAMGGNPLDISMFLRPDRAVTVTGPDGEGREVPTQPYGGAAYPKSEEPEIGKVTQAGHLVLHKYTPNKTNGRRDLSFTAQSIEENVNFARRWAAQEIRYKRNDLEARIIKLCDLREQLLEEQHDLLAQAVGGTLVEGPGFDPDRFETTLLIPHLIAEIDRLFYATDDEGRADPGQLNAEGLATYQNLLLDNRDGEEDWTAL